MRPGDDLAALIVAALEKAELRPGAGDILVVAQKVVSKAQGRYVDLATVVPSPRARELAAEVDKDPRLVEVILSEFERVLRTAPGVLIVEHRLGYVMANAGVDRSNVAPAGRHASRCCCCRSIRTAPPKPCAPRWRRASACALGVIVNDSFGRPWRRGTVGVALGAAGVQSLHDLRGNPDLYGRALQVSESALRRRGRGRRLAGDGTGATKAFRWCWCRASRLAARRRSPAQRTDPARARGSVPMTQRRRPCWRCRAASAAPSSRSASPACCRPAASPSSPTPATISSISAFDLARHRHAHLRARRPRQSGDRLGPPRRDLVVHGDARRARRRDLVPARRPRPRHACGAHAPAAGRRAALGHHGATIARRLGIDDAASCR